MATVTEPDRKRPFSVEHGRSGGAQNVEPSAGEPLIGDREDFVVLHQMFCRSESPWLLKQRGLVPEACPL